jgi:DMSO/TMAO reductase YedYZ molybdopterin-dependent catalytic subunit
VSGDKPARFPGPGVDFAPAEQFFRQEIQLALRNHGMPLEGMRYDITPTGMHYILVHFDIPDVEAGTWNLEIGGLVQKPLRLSLEDVKRRPAQTFAVTMECAGNGRALMDPRPISQPWHIEAIGTAEWKGTPLRGLLEEAGVQDSAVELVFTGLDKGVQGDEVQLYQRSLTVEEAMRDEVLLAYEMNGRPLEPQHGYPLRLLVPGWYGMTSVKWLAAIEAVAEPFRGYQQVGSYRYTQSMDDLGEPVSLINVRALIIPPGIPDFATRDRLLEPGPVTLTGRAWAGRNQVTRVEVSTDGGKTWTDAGLDTPVGPWAWRGWRCEWTAQPGRHTLCVRATDNAGNTQPTGQSWNAHGMGNNVAQWVRVLVE